MSHDLFSSANQRIDFGGEGDRPPVPPIFLRHVGTWQGEYIKTDTRGQFLSSFVGTFTVNIEGITYRQTNRYTYADGRRLQLDFEGIFEQGILKMSSSSYSDFAAIAWDAGQETIGFRVVKTQDDACIEFMETMMLRSADHRVRSTQAYRNGVFDGISFIEETRISL
ncbi:MAG: DUF3598 family protein [Oculatellaceae cyanobacterium Prado106]|jgi:hypothetical protein|nr:DUF3598 family protein [Oculatellaceae cyanobacterium Prado106]